MKGGRISVMRELFPRCRDLHSSQRGAAARLDIDEVLTMLKARSVSQSCVVCQRERERVGSMSIVMDLTCIYTLSIELSTIHTPPSLPPLISTAPQPIVLHCC
jgi:hypothetical protein